MDNYSTRNSKARPLPKPNFYHSSTYGGINYRQNDYTFATRNSALLWHDSKQMPKGEGSESKGKYCSIALAAATLLVLVAVLAIAGLALYMGALRTEPTSSPLITFLCRAKVSRGDRFLVGLTDKARRYRMQFEAMYQRSTLGPSLVSCSVDKFGNDTRTIFFRVTLNRRKIPRQVANVEKTLKDILLTDAINRKPVFPGIQFDAKTLAIKRIDGDVHQRPAAPPKAPKETLKRAPQSASVLTRNTTPAVTRPPMDGEPNDAPALPGLFKVSKTEADITMVHASSNRTLIAPSPLPAPVSSSLPPAPTTSRLKETYVTSALFKLATRKTERTTHIPSSIVPLPAFDSSTQPSTTRAIPTNASTVHMPNPYSFNPSIYNQEPWVPILHNTSLAPLLEESEHPSPHNTSHKAENPQREPIYTSFTNQGLSWQSLDAEKLGSIKLQSHPLPVNKIREVTDPIDTIYFTTPYPIYSKAQLSEDSTSKIAEIEGTERIMVPLHTHFPDTSSPIGIPQITDSDASSSSTTETMPNDFPNVGHAEVVAIEEISSIHSTKAPSVVTLLPVKSNSGVGRPIRPRPNRANQTGIHEFTRTTDRYQSATPNSGMAWKMEVVTSVSHEESRVRAHKDQMHNFHIISVLNFATEIPISTTETPETFTAQAQPLQQEETTIRQQILTPAQVAELSKISNVNVNSSNIHSNVISTKAVAGNGFEMLTKTFTKVSNESTNPNVKENKNVTNTGYNQLHNNSDSACSNFTIQCGDGRCLSNSTRCNSMVDCNDGSDEIDCTCADYLRSQFLLKKICDGVVDCWDFSDENRCEWCKPGQYVCANSKTCINRKQVCDGQSDCPHGDDERQCVTVAPNVSSADALTYNSGGYLMVRKSGLWGKLCVDNFKRLISTRTVTWEIAELGQAVCTALTYQKLESSNIVRESPLSAMYEKTPYYELALQLHNGTKPNLLFQNTPCASKEFVIVKCQSLECGTRTQIEKKTVARIVGGGNAGLAAWPWQVGFYKEGEFQCGGTLISDRWVLSAGHCFYHQKNFWVARLGNLRRSTSFSSPYEQHRTIASINLHPNYIDAGFINDISLLEMDSPVLFSDYVRPICLPQAEVPPTDGRMCTIIGWGQLLEVGRIFPDTLQEVQVPIISSAECRKRTIFLPLYQITDNMLCAGYDRGGRDACLGDSGGPLMCAEDNGRWVLHGITSNGYGCARAFRPGVYTTVANYVTWIQMQMYHNVTVSVKGGGNNATQNTCAGHRCPLGECLAKSQMCNGYIECNDGSDEKDC